MISHLLDFHWIGCQVRSIFASRFKTISFASRPKSYFTLSDCAVLDSYKNFHCFPLVSMLRIQEALIRNRCFSLSTFGELPNHAMFKIASCQQLQLRDSIVSKRWNKQINIFPLLNHFYEEHQPCRDMFNNGHCGSRSQHGKQFILPQAKYPSRITM